jgi:hypothetical protein
VSDQSVLKGLDSIPGRRAATIIFIIKFRTTLGLSELSAGE